MFTQTRDAVRRVGGAFTPRRSGADAPDAGPGSARDRRLEDADHADPLRASGGAGHGDLEDARAPRSDDELGDALLVRLARRLDAGALVADLHALDRLAALIADGDPQHRLLPDGELLDREPQRRADARRRERRENDRRRLG